MLLNLYLKQSLMIVLLESTGTLVSKKVGKKEEELVVSKGEMISELKKIQKGQEKNQPTNIEIDKEAIEENVKNVIVQDSPEIMTEEDKTKVEIGEDKDNMVIEKTEVIEETEEIGEIEEIEPKDNKKEGIKNKSKKQCAIKLMNTDSLIEHMHLIKSMLSFHFQQLFKVLFTVFEYCRSN